MKQKSDHCEELAQLGAQYSEEIRRELEIKRILAENRYSILAGLRHVPQKEAEVSNLPF